MSTKAFYFGIFDTFKKLDEDNQIIKFIGGYLATLSAICAVYPFDTLRKKMVMTTGKNYKYESQWDLAKVVYTK